MVLSLDKQAIDAALCGNWNDAVRINEEILLLKENNIDARVRLAYALSKNGLYEKACEQYHKVIELDPYNSLAHKNLKKIKEIKNHQPNKIKNICANDSISPSLFLSDAGKTRTVHLLNLTNKNILDLLTIGEELLPIAKRFELHLKDKRGNYIGTLPDDIGHPLLKLLQKNVHACRFIVKDIDQNMLTAFIKYC